MRVVLVSHDLTMRGDLARAFKAAGVEVVGEGSFVTEGLGLVDRLWPDVLITDVVLPDGGVELVRLVRTIAPALGVVVVSSVAGDDQMFAAAAAGASSFIVKDAASDEIVAAARHAQAGPRSFTSVELAGALQRWLAAKPRRKLSPREREIVNLLIDGLPVHEIARRLNIAEATLKTHLIRVWQKLGAGR